MVKKLLLALCVWLGYLSSFSQGEITLYNMRSVPQVVTQNPAFSPYSRFHFSLPVISGVGVGFANNTVGFDRLLDLQTILSTSLEDNVDLFEGLYNDLDPSTNFVAADFQLDLFRMGFKVGWNYFGLSATEKISGFANFPQQVFDLIDPTFDISAGTLDPIIVQDAGMRLSHYREYSFTYSRKVLEVLTVGASVKYLYGMENIDLQDMNIALVANTGSTPSLDWSGSARVNSSLGLLPILEGTDLDSLDILDNVTRYGVYMNNTGFGFDAGAKLELFDRFTLSASVLDIGSITWNENPNNYESGFDDTYGFEALLSDTFIFDLIDNTLESVRGGISHESYTHALTPKINVGFGLSLTDRIDLNALSYNVLSAVPRTYVMLGTSIRIRNAINLVVNYNASNVSVESVGTGLSINAGAFQFYLITDDVVSIATFGNNLNARFGINFTLSNDFED